MEAYLDNSATTRAYPEVADIMSKILTEDYGNPSSMHHMGVVAESYVKEASSVIARTLKAREKEILFTSGGTESDNLALIGAAKANQRAGRHLITSSAEHPAILNTMAYLESEGFEVTYLPTDRYGVVSPESVTEAIRPDTILVSIMAVNNEIGSVTPFEEIGRRIKAGNPKTLFHVDAVQGYGKYRIYPGRQNIDMMSVSGHKIHGPKGIGFLYIRDKVKIQPILFGGGQQSGLRSGTENVPAIAGLAKAAERIYANLDQDVERMYQIREKLTEGLGALDGVVIHGPVGRDAAPHIISAGFEGVRAEVLLHALEEREIYVSSGSACASNHPGISGTLKSVGTDPKYLESTIRFSLSDLTTMEEADRALAAVKELLPVLRKFRAR